MNLRRRMTGAVAVSIILISEVILAGVLIREALGPELSWSHFVLCGTNAFLLLTLSKLLSPVADEWIWKDLHFLTIHFSETQNEDIVVPEGIFSTDDGRSFVHIEKRKFKKGAKTGIIVVRKIL